MVHFLGMSALIVMCFSGFVYASDSVLEESSVSCAGSVANLLLDPTASIFCGGGIGSISGTVLGAVVSRLIYNGASSPVIFGWAVGTFGVPFTLLTVGGICYGIDKCS